MRAVVDTNVLVSAFLNPHGLPARVMDAILSLQLTPVVSPGILAEYTEVLLRPKFGFASEEILGFMKDFTGLAISVPDLPDDGPLLPDPDDALFVVAARIGQCPIITGNIRHYPPECGVEILTPAQWWDHFRPGAGRADRPR